MITRVAVLIPTWDGIEMTSGCIRSLIAAGVCDSTIWVLDNGSRRPAAPLLREHAPEVRVVRLPRNLGFAGGCNAGMSAALAEGTDAVFLLNNDVLVERDTLPSLVAALEADPQLAAVGPKILYAARPDRFQSVGVAVDPESGRLAMLGRDQSDHGQFDRPANRAALQGCAMLVRAEAWRQVGGFWEPFFNYFEEIDWCLRARRAGWRLRYVPRARVWHFGSSTLGSESRLRVYLIARNQWYLRRRHQTGGWRGRLGACHAGYILTRTCAHYARRRRLDLVHAALLGAWDFFHGRSGNARTADLRL